MMLRSFFKADVVKCSDWSLSQVNFVIVLESGQFIGKRGCYVKSVTFAALFQQPSEAEAALVAMGLEGRATVGTVSIRSRQVIVAEKEIVIESEVPNP